jgi:hypothetical protein
VLDASLLFHHLQAKRERVNPRGKRGKVLDEYWHRTKGVFIAHEAL